MKEMVLKYSKKYLNIDNLLLCYVLIFLILASYALNSTFYDGVISAFCVLGSKAPRMHGHYIRLFANWMEDYPLIFLSSVFPIGFRLYLFVQSFWYSLLPLVFLFTSLYILRLQKIYAKYMIFSAFFLLNISAYAHIQHESNVFVALSWLVMALYVVRYNILITSLVYCVLAGCYDATPLYGLFFIFVALIDLHKHKYKQPSLRRNLIFISTIGIVYLITKYMFTPVVSHGSLYFINDMRNIAWKIMKGKDFTVVSIFIFPLILCVKNNLFKYILNLILFGFLVYNIYHYDDSNTILYLADNRVLNTLLTPLFLLALYLKKTDIFNKNKIHIFFFATITFTFYSYSHLYYANFCTKLEDVIHRQNKLGGGLINLQETHLDSFSLVRNGYWPMPALCAQLQDPKNIRSICMTGWKERDHELFSRGRDKIGFQPINNELSSYHKYFNFQPFLDTQPKEPAHVKIT